MYTNVQNDFEERTTTTLKTYRSIVTGAAAVALSAFLTAFVFQKVPAVLAGQELSAKAFTISNGISIAFNIDPAGMVFACVSSALWLLITIYSIGYMREAGWKQLLAFHAAAAISVAAATGMYFAANMATLFIFYVLLAAASCPLTLSEESSRVGRRYLIYMLASVLVFLAGLLLIGIPAGQIVFKAGGFLTDAMLTKHPAIVIFIMLVIPGCAAAGVMPLHSWIISSRSASAPANAVMQAAALMNAGVFSIYRVVLYVFGPEMTRSCGGADILTLGAMLTIIISSLIALSKTDIRAKIAYSTISQLACIIIGTCIFTPFSTAGALYHAAAHGFAKAALIMSAGAVILNTRSAEITDNSGAGRRMPAYMGAFAAASAAAAGLPAFAGFISQISILYGAVNAGKPLYAAAVIACSVFTIANLMPVVLAAFRKTDRNTEITGIGRTDPFMIIAIIAACLVVLILGIAPNLRLHLFDLSLMTGNTIFDPLM